jgi:hexosaminidase
VKAPLLIPAPRKILLRDGSYVPPPTLEMELAGFTLGSGSPRGIEARVEPGAAAESYRLTVRAGGVSLIAADRAGMFYGIMTLRQLLRAAGRTAAIPCLQIEDRPEFPVRGVMLDISRDRVPTMECLKGLIDLWSELKINQVQLYTEHTFAYPEHGIVWKDASPVSPREAEELDRYCAERAVELVPNQNSFGHMERWLRHPPYRGLAEATGSFTDPWGGVRHEPTTLDPLHPGSLDLLRGLFEELLPHFSSRMVNVGGDEPLGLGQGRSREACARQGPGRVYLDFLLKIHEELARRGRIMQFYGDVIVQCPELIREIPREAIVLEWGYEAGHPFSEECRLLAEAALPFYVCPGTSAWNSLGGRFGNARDNILGAAAQGRRAGAGGLLLTDWGDNGHWQQLPVSYPAYLLGAAASWNPQAAGEIDIEACLSEHLFRDPSGNAARALMILENVQDEGMLRFRNAGALAVLLIPDLQPYHLRELEHFRGYDFGGEQARIRESLSLLEQAEMRSRDGELLRQELRFTADLMMHAARLGKERFATPGQAVAEIAPSRRAELAVEMEGLIGRYEKLWLARSRPGGLSDSAGRLTAVKNSYLSP